MPSIPDEPTRCSEQGYRLIFSYFLNRTVHTMTEDLSLQGIGTQTDAVFDADGKQVVFYNRKDKERVSGEVRALDVEIQTELDLKKIYEETEKSRRNHARSLRGLQRKFLAIRRCCQKKGTVQCKVL